MLELCTLLGQEEDGQAMDLAQDSGELRHYLSRGGALTHLLDQVLQGIRTGQWIQQFYDAYAIYIIQNVGSLVQIASDFSIITDA